MGLNTDFFFVAGLRDSNAVQRLVQGRIFNTARSTEDERKDKVPYIIVSFDGLTNDSETKDDGVEGTEDRVTVSLLVVAHTRVQLAELAQAARDAMRAFFDSVDANDDAHQYAPKDWEFSAGQVQYDWTKPCCYQTLRYVCVTDD